MPLEIVRNDLTKMDVDAIVNAANPELKMGGGVCGAIFQAAGAKELEKACEKIGSCAVGQAVMTEGFDLPASFIIHTPGPIWQGGSNQEAELLKASYNNSLKLAKTHGVESIAFPLISTGIFGYPKEEALQIAVSTISSFLLEQDMLVYIVVFDKKSFRLSKKLFSSINEYIDEHYVDEVETMYSRTRRAAQYALKPLTEQSIFKEEEIEGEYVHKENSLVDLVKNLDESFSERLLRFIDERGMTDVETYTRANLNRRLFSKIRTNPDYHPKKKTAIAFAIALKLNIAETNELLAAAGYTLSHSNKFDVIVEYFIHEGNYNIHELNEALFAFDQPLVGG